MLHTWLRSPLNVRVLKAAATALGPVCSQFRHSFYIFCFHLPWPLTNLLGTFGNYWFVRVLHSLGNGKGEGKLDKGDAGEAMAMSTGPGLEQLDTLKTDTIKYGESVRRRAHGRGMSEKIKIYRDGLFLDKWEKSLETTAALFDIASETSGPLLSDEIIGSLKAPTTFMLGEHDPAFDRRLTFDNFKDYLVGGGQAMLVKGAGHWLQLEPCSRHILEKVILWALTGHNSRSTPSAAMEEVVVVASRH